VTTDRRAFITQSSALVLALGKRDLDPLATDAFSPSFVHHVLFWLKDPQDLRTRDEIVRSLREFRTIAGVEFVHVGTPTVSTNPMEASATDSSYTLAYLVLFKDKAAEDTYLAHPLYARFLERFKDAAVKVVIHDSLRIDL
jgi:hypothetical protein